MTRKYTAIIAVVMGLSAFASGTVSAEQTLVVKSNEQAAESQLKVQLAKLHNLQANYVQTVFDSQGSQVMSGSGEIKLKRPEKLYWQQTLPDETLLVSNGDKTFYFDEFAEQVTILNSQKLIQSTPFALLTSNNDSLWQDYQVKLSDKVFSISPVQAGNSQVERLELSFKGETLSTMAVFDNTGQVSRYVFSKQQVNQEINDSQFSFTIPDGVLVDDQSQGE